MSGEAEDFVVHLSGAAQLRKWRRHWRGIGGSTRQLNEISAFLILLARTLSFLTPPPLWIGNDDDISYTEDTLAEAVPSGRCYIYMYGITPNIAAAIQETCRLSERLAQLNSNQKQNAGLILFDECEALGDRLLSWSFDSENAASTLAGDETMSKIFENYAKAWHCAALIYYYDRIQHYNVENLAEQAEYVTKHMHIIEDIKATSKYETINKMAPITWPMFIASCISMRSRRESHWRWWERVQHYGIATLRIQWDAVQMIWEKGDEIRQGEFGSSNWMDIYCHLGITLLPI
jgi:arginine metabolism regulation protein II